MTPVRQAPASLIRCGTVMSCTRYIQGLRLLQSSERAGWDRLERLRRFLHSAATVDKAGAAGAPPNRL
jgi:hypothetical protein